MLKRRPDLPRHMEGGIENPLGARAMYLGESMYRIHGSNEPDTIGQAVSSGCIRMTNDDVADLYDRVKVGTKAVIHALSQLTWLDASKGRGTSSAFSRRCRSARQALVRASSAR